MKVLEDGEDVLNVRLALEASYTPNKRHEVLLKKKKLARRKKK